MPRRCFPAGANPARSFSFRPVATGADSGKSSILNALIGEPLFSVNIDPETAVQAEVTYGASESLTGCLPDSRRLPLDREAVRENRLDARLRSPLESLVSQAINGSDLQGSIGATVRLTVEEERAQRRLCRRAARIGAQLARLAAQQQELAALRQRFFTDLKRIGDAVGVLLPEPRDIDLLSDTVSPLPALQILS